MVGETKAWTSTSMVRVPSNTGTMAAPGLGARSRERKKREGFCTSSIPRSPILNTATSWVEPKRFFTDLSIRRSVSRTPSR